MFPRPDAQIAQEVRELLTEILFADPATVKVAVHGSVVTLTGPGQDDLIPVAVRLIWDIDGVVDKPGAGRAGLNRPPGVTIEPRPER